MILFKDEQKSKDSAWNLYEKLKQSKETNKTGKGTYKS